VAFQRRKSDDIGVKAPLPGFIEPALASAIERVPSGSRWIHEIKFDGYRVQVHLANEAVQIFTRRGHDWTHRFKKVAHDAWHIKAGSAVIDGEIVVPAADGTTDFSVLQNELKGKSTSIVLVAFDLLYLNGRDLRKVPLFQRKAAELKKIIAGTDVQFSESFEVDGQEMFAHACKVGLEGVVSKVRDSVYPTGRSNDWVKKTCAQRETLTIAGFAFDGSKWDGLFVGRRKGDDLVYAGQDRPWIRQGLQRRLDSQAAASARAFRRITCGGCPKARRKARRMRSRSAKPVCRAMISIGWRLCSIIRRAVSTRRFSTALAGDWPVSAWNARLNWRGLRCAAFANSRTVSFEARLRFA